MFGPDSDKRNEALMGATKKHLIPRPGDAHEVAKAICRQLVPIGFGWTHSLVLERKSETTRPPKNAREYGARFMADRRAAKAKRQTGH